MHLEKAAAIGVERQFTARGSAIFGDEGSGLAARQWTIVTPRKQLESRVQGDD
jgi:hypothetical protein